MRELSILSNVFMDFPLFSLVTYIKFRRQSLFLLLTTPITCMGYGLHPNTIVRVYIWYGFCRCNSLIISCSIYQHVLVFPSCFCWWCSSWTTRGGKVLYSFYGMFLMMLVSVVLFGWQFIFVCTVCLSFLSRSSFWIIRRDNQIRSHSPSQLEIPHVSFGSTSRGDTETAQTRKPRRVLFLWNSNTQKKTIQTIVSSMSAIEQTFWLFRHLFVGSTYHCCWTMKMHPVVVSQMPAHHGRAMIIMTIVIIVQHGDGGSHHGHHDRQAQEGPTENPRATHEVGTQEMHDDNDDDECVQKAGENERLVGRQGMAVCSVLYHIFFSFSVLSDVKSEECGQGHCNSHKPPQDVFLGWPRFFLSTTKALLERMLPQSTWSSRYYDIKTIAYHSPWQWIAIPYSQLRQ